MDITLIDIAESAMETKISTKPMKRQSVTLDFMVMDNGEIGVFGIELKDGFSINIDATFAGT